MKIGIEVEGRLKGVRTLFCDASEWEQALGLLELHKCVHLYISDRENKVDLFSMESQLPAHCLVTVERTSARPKGLPPRVVYMLALPNYEEVESLLPTDMVKVDKDMHVLIAPMSSVIETLPSAFDGDEEI